MSPSATVRLTDGFLIVFEQHWCSIAPREERYQAVDKQYDTFFFVCCVLIELVDLKLSLTIIICYMIFTNSLIIQYKHSSCNSSEHVGFDCSFSVVIAEIHRLDLSDHVWSFMTASKLMWAKVVKSKSNFAPLVQTAPIFELCLCCDLNYTSAKFCDDAAALTQSAQTDRQTDR